MDKSKVCVIHNGIDDYLGLKCGLRKQFSIPHSMPVIGTVCRLYEPKQPLFAIRVVKELKDRGHKLKYIIIGDGPLMGECIELICRLWLQTDVILLGERNNVRDLILDFNIFTLFSKWEGFLITIIEAMFAGLPVVASKAGGIPELIENGVNGYLVEKSDIIEAADCIESILNNRALRIKMGDMCRDRACKNFTKGDMIKKYRHLYFNSLALTVKCQEQKKNHTFKFKIVSFFNEKANENSSAAKTPSITKNFSWVFSGNTIYALSKGLIITLIAKFGTAEMVGQFALALAITTSVFMLSNLNLRLILATDNQKHYRFVDYLHLRIITTIIGFLICAIFAFTIKPDFQQTVIILFMSAARGVESLSDIILGMFQNKEKMENIEGISENIINMYICNYCLIYLH